MTELFHAILNPSGPNFEHWNEVLGGHRVPIKSGASVLATLGDEQNVEVYLLDLQAMTLKQRSRLLSFIAKKFDVPIYEVEEQLRKSGFPIRAEDVIVSYDMRAFA